MYYSRMKTIASKSTGNIIRGLRSYLYCIAVGLLTIACHSSIKAPMPDIVDDGLIAGKASPITLNEKETVVILEDYVLSTARIDSVTVTTGLVPDVQQSRLILKGTLPDALGNLSLWSKGQHYDILLKRANKTTVSLTYSGQADQVSVKGEFNNWNPANTSLKKKGSAFTTEVRLNPGRYQYLMVVDGQEMLDSANAQSVGNGNGGKNSLIDIPRTPPEELPRLTTVSYEKDKLSLASSLPTKGLLVYWDNFLLNESFIEQSPDGLTLNLTIPKEAKLKDRSFMRVWAYNKNGASNELLIPLDSGQVLSHYEQLQRSDKEAHILYFLMVDRFFNGNLKNDRPVPDKTVHPKANYKGGDLVGITQKLREGYFQQLGINTLWLSPITQNPMGAYGHYPKPSTTFSGYHGYWPISSTKVDMRFGTSEELKELVTLAHERDMNILLDYVANHVHEEHPVYQQHKDWATKLHLPDGTLNTERWDEHRLTTWFDTFLPTLDLSRPEIVDPMTDSALYWLQTYDLDGLRHDATKHIPLMFWRTLTQKIKSELPSDKTVYQIGETYGSRELINSYINMGMLDAQFDFNVYDDAVATFAKPEVPFVHLTSSLKESLAYYGEHNLMGYITGNQDRARFISYADGSLRFDEDAKLAGWTRQIEVQDSLAYRKLTSLTAFMMGIPGIPVIYYGDEIGSPGGNDPDNRRMMRFDSLKQHELWTRRTTSKLIALRKTSLALMYGDIKMKTSGHNGLIIQRSYFNEHVLLIFNKSKVPKVFDLIDYQIKDTPMNLHFEGKLSKSAQVEVPAYSFEVITFSPTKL